MPQFDNDVVGQILWPSFLAFFFIGGLVAAAVGVALIVNSGAVLRVFGRMNRVISMRQLTKPMAVPIDSSRFVSTYRGWFGAFFVLGALYAVYGLIARVNNAAVVSLLNLKLPPEFVLWIVQSTRLFLIVSCSFSILVGVLLSFFPATMHAMEQRASYWVSTRRMGQPAERMNLTLDGWVAGSPRAAGWLIVFPALALVAYFGGLLFGPA